MNLHEYVSEGRGAQTLLANKLTCQPQLVWQWVSGVRSVPADRCPAIERATDGKVPCETLRPDVSWTRITDAGWPWHPQGRPLIDVTVVKVAEEVRDAA